MVAAGLVAAREVAAAELEELLPELRSENVLCCSEAEDPARVKAEECAREPAEVEPLVSPRPICENSLMIDDAGLGRSRAWLRIPEDELDERLTTDWEPRIEPLLKPEIIRCDPESRLNPVDQPLSLV